MSSTQPFLYRAAQISVLQYSKRTSQGLSSAYSAGAGCTLGAGRLARLGAPTPCGFLANVIPYVDVRPKDVVVVRVKVDGKRAMRNISST